jgi:Fur family transcriptional regulator, ferric uptake regulator
MSRNTDQRDAITAVMTEAGRPLRPDEVLEFAQQRVPSVGVATVYRNLKRLTASGELRAVELPGQRTTLYEVAHLHHHHHFHCNTCDKVYDIDVCPGDFAGLVPDGFQVQRHDLVLYGSCPACAV